MLSTAKHKKAKVQETAEAKGRFRQGSNEIEHFYWSKVLN
jgi:hypothetical protein